MSKQLLQLNQIAGIQRDNLYDEIVGVIEKNRSYKEPVRDASNLPIINNADGDTRLVFSQDEYYMWDSINNNWSIIRNRNIETKISIMTIGVNNQRSFGIPFLLGLIKGIASINSIEVAVNGITQTKGVDYDITYDYNLTNNITLTWISSDFSLETTDILKIMADILII